MNVEIFYYLGELPLVSFSGNLDDAPRENVVWIDITVGKYSQRLLGFDYYFIDGWKVGGWYTTSDTFGKGYCWKWSPHGVQSQTKFVMPRTVEPFIGVQVPQPDSIILGLE